MDDAPDSAPAGRPVVTLAVAAAVSALEGVAFAAYSVFVLVEALRLGATGPREVSNVPGLVLEIVILATFGVGLLLVARGLRRVRRWARAPFVLMQLLVLVVGIPLAQAGDASRIAGFALVALAVAGAGSVLSPSATQALTGE